MSTAAARFVGESVRRVEDPRILTGGGRYLDDISLPGLLHAVFARSPLAHARILSIDTDAARAVPGVAAVLTDADLDKHIASLQCPAPIPNLQRPVFSALATDKVRMMGNPVALVLATTRAEAEDAVEAIDVEYEPLEVVATIEHARDHGRAVIFEEISTNHLYAERIDLGDPDAAFAAADRVIEHRVAAQRVSQVPMEGRGGLADYRPGTGELTYHASTQTPHSVRQALAGLLGHPAERLRVIVPDVGGAFGQKVGASREDLAVCAAAKLLGRPVKWVEDRVENLLAAGQAREETVDVRAAVKSDGTILGLEGPGNSARPHRE
jgi:carbon-monoxide dehydrogenase large subunit